jgi:hypothetical protein
MAAGALDVAAAAFAAVVLVLAPAGDGGVPSDGADALLAAMAVLVLLAGALALVAAARLRAGRRGGQALALAAAAVTAVPAVAGLVDHDFSGLAALALPALMLAVAAWLGGRAPR